jgi:hypothetical protein
MRLSSLVIAAVLVCSLPLFAQHSAGGGSSTGGHSGGGFSGGGGSSGSSHSGSIGGSSSSSRSAGGDVSSSSGRGGSSGPGSSHTSSGLSFSARPSGGSFRSPERTGLNIRPNLLRPPVTDKIEEKPEKKGVFSFLHHKKPVAERANFINPRPRCRPGQQCFVRTGCRTKLAWNASYCGGLYDQYDWFNACRSLADQLARQREQMRTTNDAGASLRYRMLQDQYRQCMMRNGVERFSSYLFMSDLYYP